MSNGLPKTGHALVMRIWNKVRAMLPTGWRVVLLIQAGRQAYVCDNNEDKADSKKMLAHAVSRYMEPEKNGTSL